MRLMPYLVKNSAGVWCVQRKVPAPLQAAVARVLGSKQKTQVFLKKSLGTKDRRLASKLAPGFIANIERTLAEAKQLTEQQKSTAKPRSQLSATEITRMTDYFYADMLAFDEQSRFHGRAGAVRAVEWIRRNEDPDFELSYPLESVPEFGITPERLQDLRQQNANALTTARELLARGDIDAMKDQVELLLDQFEIELDRDSTSYRELGLNVLRTYVRACEALAKRDTGEDVPTPQQGGVSAAASSGTLKDAFEGWKKERDRPGGTVHEYGRAIEMFVQLHGNLPLIEIKRSHALRFREALQLVPRNRKGHLLNASLPELSAWGKEHATAPKVSKGTVNKQLGALQAIAGWGRHSGLVPEDAPWTDPFGEMRLEEEQSQREPFDLRELQKIFNDPLFTEHKLPVAAKGAAGVWLPLLALFGGARQGEYAGLRASEIREDEQTRIPLMWFAPDRKSGRRLKTKSSERVVPIHTQLIKLGFLDYVATRREEGEQAWLFPTVAPDQRGALSAFAKWWGRHLRTHVGVKDTNKVFHSFRHGFTDRARSAGVDAELRKALMGHADDNTVSGGYGAKRMLDRWGARTLKAAIEKISYPGLDLSRVRPMGTTKRSRGTPKAKRPASLRGKSK